MPRLRQTNEVIAAFLACGGQMNLYAHLNKHEERALYNDTDSVIFVHKDGESPLVQWGDSLGDMTFELKQNE